MSDPTKAERAYLVLADGTIFEGIPFGARATTVGEAVFTTTTTGYQEVLTDPSYKGQLVAMTAPQIGNVGVNAVDNEAVANRPHVAGFIIRDLSEMPSNWRSEEALGSYLARHGVVGISDVDTRRLTRHLRDKGAQNGAIGVENPEVLLRKAREAPNMSGLDLVREVTPKVPYTWNEGTGSWAVLPRRAAEHHVVAVDFGIKRNILRCLADSGCKLTVVPATTSAREILGLKPDGIFLSNGPGDPAAVTYAIDTLRDLVGRAPIFGICLGHQLLSHALGGKTYKLKFGHRGANQPVKHMASGRIEITTQNHGFCVDLQSLPAGIESTHVHLNDSTSEGLALKSSRVFSVQYHPEAAAGPHDSLYLFEQFAAWMNGKI